MQEKSLTNKKIAITVANGFTESQMAEIQRVFVQKGASLKTVSVENGLVSGWSVDGWGLNFPVEQGLSTCLSSDFDMFVVLGGARSVEKLKANPHMKRILRGCMENKLPVLLLNEAVTALSLVELSQPMQVSARAGDVSSLSNVEAIDQDVVVYDHIVTGVLNADTAAIIDAAIEMLSGTVMVEDQKIAA